MSLVENLVTPDFLINVTCLVSHLTSQMKMFGSKYTLNGLLPIAFDLIISWNRCWNQTKNTKIYRRSKNEIAFSCSQIESKHTDRKKELNTEFWCRFGNGFVAFIWNLWLFTIAEAQIRMQYGENALVKTQSSIYAGNSRCWWHKTIFSPTVFFPLSSLFSCVVVWVQRNVWRCRLFVLKSLYFF